MSRKALKVVVELKFRAVSCPGVHLPAKDDIYLSMWFMGQYCQSECLPAVFPLLFHEKMTFEKIFRHIVDPGDIAVMLEYETVTIELVQLIPPVMDTLACFEEDARRFLFPEPKLVPCSTGVDQEVLMTRAPHFAGIAPRLEFSTKTTIIECSADAEINIYPNVLMANDREEQETVQPTQEVLSSEETTSNSWNETRWQDVQRKTQRCQVTIFHSQTRVPVSSKSWKHTEETLCSSLPSRLGHSARLSAYGGGWPGASRPATRPAPAVFTNSSSPLTRSSAIVRYSPTVRRKSLSNGLVGEISEDDSSSSETHDPNDNHQLPDPSGLWRSYREQARHSRSQSSSHREWEEIQERVRGLLTTPKAVRRLVYGATHCEVDKVLARRSISPGPQ